MRLFSLIFTLLFPLTLFSYDIKQVRLEFYASLNSESATEKLYKKLKNADLSDPLLLAYFGSSDALRAKHSINPYKKIAYLKTGLKNINEAISASPENLEIRFLRFSLQHYIPAFLGFSQHLAVDRKKIVELIEKKQLGKVDKPLLSNIISFLKETKRCTVKEIAILDQAV